MLSSQGRQAFNTVLSLLRNSFNGGVWLVRGLNTELTAALRPFYFVVHPDLFGQHPLQRKTNEESLQQLSAHLEALYEHKPSNLGAIRQLKFYVREESATTRDTFKLITIQLDNRVSDPKSLIQKLLESCNLSTEYISKVNSTTSPTAKVQEDGFKPGMDYAYGSAEFSNFKANFEQEKEIKRQSLEDWIVENAQLAMQRSNDAADLKAEVDKLQRSLVARLGLRDARYDCGWNIDHYRGCLKTLERLANLHLPKLHVLRDRVVVFAPFTGISLEGHVMLYTGDVINNWIDFIKVIPEHDAFLKIVPVYERSLSQVLLGIRIARRKFMPKQQAKEYAKHLMNVTTAINDFLSKRKFPKSWPLTMKEFEIVVESEAGPLMVSPTGQFITPATCPGWILVDFISVNMELARARIGQYEKDKYIERVLIEECIVHLKLKSLTKDDSITPDKMIASLQHLLKYHPAPFDSIRLHISNYYSVLADGIVCIPWDFMTK